MMVGIKIPESDEHWVNYLDLLRIMDLLLAPRIIEDDICNLAVMISDHHLQFKELYPHATITPKMHYMVHMPRLMLKYVNLMFSINFVHCISCLQIWPLKATLDNALRSQTFLLQETN